MNTDIRDNWICRIFFLIPTVKVNVNFFDYEGQWDITEKNIKFLITTYNLKFIVIISSRKI